MWIRRSQLRDWQQDAAQHVSGRCLLAQQAAKRTTRFVVENQSLGMLGAADLFFLLWKQYSDDGPKLPDLFFAAASL